MEKLNCELQVHSVFGVEQCNFLKICGQKMRALLSPKFNFREKNIMRVTCLVTVFSMVFLSSLVFANGATSYTQVGRYLTEKNGAQVSQCDPLQTVFDVTFPSTVITVGDAIRYLLSNTGYRFVPSKYQSAAVHDLLNQKLSLSDRTMESMTVEQGLLALAGRAYQMLVDPRHRYISYQLRRQYQQLYDN